MATKTILFGISVSSGKFKKNRSEALKESDGQSVAVISHNKPTFYIVSPIRYDAMLEEVDDLNIVHIVTERLKQRDRAMEVKLDDL
jgi:antitoxin StbD